MVVHNIVENHIRKISFVFEFGQWLCRKPSAGLIWAAPSGVQYAAAAPASTVKQAQGAASAR